MAQETKKKKRPTAEKRMIQNEKRREENRRKRSKIRTAVKRLQESLTAGTAQEKQEKLNTVYSLLDKGVKTGLIKKNRASRTKARLAAKCAASLS